MITLISKNHRYLGPLDQLQMLGFRKATLPKFEEINKLTIEQAIRKLAKAFVNGNVDISRKLTFILLKVFQIRVNRLSQINLFLCKGCQIVAEII